MFCHTNNLCRGSSTIIEDIRTIVQAQTGFGLTYFYFDINDNAQQTLEQFLSSLVYALTANSKKYSLLSSLYEVHQKIYKPTDSELFDVLKELLEFFTQVYIVIDALDECTEYDQLFGAINNILGWTMSNCHLLVTSRREERILLMMEECTPVEIQLSADLIESDITSYIHYAVGNVHKLKRWNPTVQEKVKETLIKGANGMYVCPKYCNF